MLTFILCPLDKYVLEAKYLQLPKCSICDTSFWCSDVADIEPCIDMVFDEPISANTLLMIQYITERRVEEIQLQTYIDDQWVDLTTLNGLNGKQIISSRFETVFSNRFRVKMLKTITSENGFSIPNIMLLKIFENCD